MKIGDKPKVGIGDKIRIKRWDELVKITGIKGRFTVQLRSGLLFHCSMLGYAGKQYEIENIAIPGKDNRLKKPTYKIKGADVFFSRELFDLI